MIKSELRKIYLAKQRSLSPEARLEKSRQISDRFFQNFDLAGIKILHCFISIEKFTEIDTGVIFQRLWREFPAITTVVPRVDLKTGDMQNLKFTPDTELVKNIWDIHEPAHDECVATADIDMVIVPLLCFDRSGQRVGYGKGFYDRFLRNCREDCVKAGLSYFGPVDEISDAGELDIKLDHCFTPDGVRSQNRER